MLEQVAALRAVGATGLIATMPDSSDLEAVGTAGGTLVEAFA